MVRDLPLSKKLNLLAAPKSNGAQAVVKDRPGPPELQHWSARGANPHHAEPASRPPGFQTRPRASCHVGAVSPKEHVHAASITKEPRKWQLESPLADNPHAQLGHTSVSAVACEAHTLLHPALTALGMH
eukprot:2380627-Amphidinium_carterae.2